MSGVEAQSARYAAGRPTNLPAHRRPLPFLFESNGSKTYFTNGLDPTPRSREVFNVPRPETLAELLNQPAQLRARLKALPPLDETGLWKVQIRAIQNLEASLAKSDPRALIQMATGSGKTFTAVNIAYRLLKCSGAKRILFLVDRANLGKQTEDEFANFEPPDDPRKFPALYTVQRLKTNAINPAANVVITTIQRLYSMLKGDAEFDPGNEDGSAFDAPRPWQGDPPDVAYNAAIPHEGLEGEVQTAVVCRGERPADRPAWVVLDDCRSGWRSAAWAPACTPASPRREHASVPQAGKRVRGPTRSPRRQAHELHTSGVQDVRAWIWRHPSERGAEPGAGRPAGEVEERAVLAPSHSPSRVRRQARPARPQ